MHFYGTPPAPAAISPHASFAVSLDPPDSEAIPSAKFDSQQLSTVFSTANSVRAARHLGKGNTVKKPRFLGADQDESF
jgi:hypothetical protein